MPNIFTSVTYVVLNTFQTIKCIGYGVMWQCNIISDDLLGHKITDWVVSMGSGFIKLSQILSSNKDMLPDWLSVPLVQLQDNAPKLHLFNNRGVPEILQEIDITMEPINCASVSEIYRGTYNQRAVVIKILKPGIRDELMFAYNILWVVCVVIEAVSNLTVLGRVENIMKTFMDQVNFEKEVQNNKTYTEMVQIDTIVTPKIYDQFCTKDIIVMDYIDGHKTTDISVGSNDALYITNVLLGLVIQSIFVNGCIHCDLHPGNIIVTKETPPRIGVIDFGLIYVLNDAQKQNIMMLFSMYASKNAGMFAQITSTFCKPSDNLADPDFIKAGHDIMGEVLQDTINVIKFIKSLTNLFDKYSIEYNDELVMFELAWGSISGTMNQVTNNACIDDLIKDVLMNITAM